VHAQIYRQNTVWKLTTTFVNTRKLTLMEILIGMDCKLSQNKLPGLSVDPGNCQTKDLTSEAPDVTPWGFAHLMGYGSVP
jgi:hypothetical protein